MTGRNQSERLVEIIRCAHPEPDRAAIEAQALAHAAKFSGSLRTSMIDFGKVRFTIERHGDKLTTFDQWKAERSTIS